MPTLKAIHIAKTLIAFRTSHNLTISMSFVNANKNNRNKRHRAQHCI